MIIESDIATKDIKQLMGRFNVTIEDLREVCDVSRASMENYLYHKIPEKHKNTLWRFFTDLQLKELLEEQRFTELSVSDILDIARLLNLNKMDLADACGETYPTMDRQLSSDADSQLLPSANRIDIIRFFREHLTANGTPRENTSNQLESEMEESQPEEASGSENGQQIKSDPDSDKQPFEILGEITADDIPPAGNFTKGKYEGIADRARELEVDKGFKARVENSSAAGTVKKLFKRRFKERTFDVVQRKGGGTWRLYIIRKS